MVNLHYCMGKVDSISISSEAADICGRCGMHTEEDNHCCRDEFKFVKFITDQQSAQNTVDLDWPVWQITGFTVFPSLVPNDNTGVSLTRNHSPPPLTAGQPVYLRNCVFRL